MRHKPEVNARQHELDLGGRLRDEAIARVREPTENVYDELVVLARMVVRPIPDGRLITSADLIRAVAGDAPEPAEPRVWGAVMRRLAADGLIKPTKQFITYPRASRHNAPSRVWMRTTA